MTDHSEPRAACQTGAVRGTSNSSITSTRSVRSRTSHERIPENARKASGLCANGNGAVKARSISAAPSSSTATSGEAEQASRVPNSEDNGSPDKQASKAIGKPPMKPKAKASARSTRRLPSKKDPLALDESLIPIPHGLLCPICRDLFADPVATVDGHSYCQTCIKQWFVEFDRRVADFYASADNIAPGSRKLPPTLIAPMTSLPLPARNLQPNVALRQAVEAFKTSRPLALDRERERRDLKKLFDELEERREFILDERNKTDMVQELTGLRLRVAELEEQLSRATTELKEVKAREEVKVNPDACSEQPQLQAAEPTPEIESLKPFPECFALDIPSVMKLAHSGLALIQGQKNALA